MARRRIGRSAAYILWVTMLALWLPAAALAQTEKPNPLAKQTIELYKAGEFKKALAAAERWVQHAEQNKEVKDNLASALLNKAWCALFVHQPEKALAASERALKFAPYFLGIETNRAHALLFLGRTEEARAIYLGHKGEYIGEQGKWEAVIAQDFKELRERGLGHPAMAAIEKALAAAPDNAQARASAELGPLSMQFFELFSQEKYAEAIPVAQKTVALTERVLGKRHPDTLASITVLAALYDKQGSYTKSEPLYQRAIEGSEQTLGKDHSSTLIAINKLAELYRIQGRHAEAEPLLNRVVKTYERTLGKEAPETLTGLNNLALLYYAQGRYVESESLFRRVLTARERVLGKEHPNTLNSLANFAEVYSTQGRYAEAEPLTRRALKDRERVLGKEHADTLTSVNNLALLYKKQGRYALAEPLYRRALETRERVLGKEHPETLHSVNNLALLYDAQGRYAEAEPLFRRALEVSERTLGKENPETLVSVNNIAGLYFSQGRYEQAEPLLKRILKASERVLGKEHPDTLTSINNLAELYNVQGKYWQAEPLFRRAIATQERVLGKEHPKTLTSISNLAELYRIQGRYRGAEPLYRRVLAARERALGKEHPDTLTSVNNLAVLLSGQGRHAEAEPLFQRAIAAQEQMLGKEHPNTLTLVSNLAKGYFQQRNWPRAAALWRRSTAGIAERTQQGALTASVTSKKQSEVELGSRQFSGLVKAVYRLAPEGHATEAAAREMFQTAQWALSSEAARSLAQMAARGASGDPKLSALARERQDLAAEWQKLEAGRNAALSLEPAKRNAKAEAENKKRMAVIGVRIAEIDKRLKTEFPDYAALASPAPISVEEVQAQLHADEALVLFLDTEKLTPEPEETFIWVVTKTDVRWVRSDLGTAALTTEVQALRCGLDANAWKDRHCAKLLDADFGQADINTGKPLPFDHARAHKLYKALFGQMEDLVGEKKLLIVPSGPLTQLPFQALVTAPPSKETDNKSAAWLARSHAVTILPAVSSLKALRRLARASTATKPLIGFGNPLLDGQQNHRNPQFAEYFKELAERARNSQQCNKAASQPIAARRGWRGGIASMDKRGGLAQIAFIRMQTPLPETADELCSVARDLHADASELRLGAQATEHEVKRLNANGQLAQYRIVHFATHGALAGELRGTSEPGLILTPPATASEDDDGYLSAGEIAGLKLDADWVILSACNTAAGDAKGAQALSGLARAFIYAQARTLLVSHWAVDSDATVKLITGATRETGSDPKVGRAEALRRSMLALINEGEEREAHPAYWAPFIVVGEGAR